MLETRKSNPVAASEEHDLAAGEFSSVGGSSTDREVCAVVVDVPLWMVVGLVW